jgi:hypothetical protein
MKAYLRLLLWRILSRPIVRAVGWTDAETKQFAVFCASSCGAKLFELLRQTVASVTFNAVYAESVSGNARARGMQEVLALLYRLRSLPLEEASEYQDEDVEPLPSQKKGASIDGRRWGLSGGNSAIGTMK